MLKIGYIGVGNRGTSMLRNILDCFSDKVEIKAVCDLFEDRVQRGIDLVKEKTGKTPFGTTNSDEVMKMDIDAVMVMAAWEAHIPLAVAAMKAGKRVAMEVAGAYSLDDCFRLVRTSEETGMGCMLLENCCYGRTELAVICAVLGLALLYQLLIQRKRLIKKQYNTTVQSMTEEKWIRTITFDDKITVADGNNSSVFAYSDYKWAGENDKYYLLYRNENIVLRIEKGSFTYGNEKDFLRWINNKLK